ncbi:MAG TPA: hypothetical protein VGR92_22710 [Steroidobacteraceae bacterium]|nr:hypothetical protein [Steroidobacteraceae bacterium]
MAKHTARAVRLGSILLSGLVLLSLAAPSRADMSIYGLYDLRHLTDPADNSSDFPVIEMKGFFPLSFGSFLFKEEIDLDGTRKNQSEVYSELDQSIKLGRATLWGAPLLLHLGYSGGLGVFKDGAGGYYVQNAYTAGPEYGFQVAGAYCDVYAALRRTDITRPSYDPMISFWVGKFFFGYKLLIANSLQAWTAYAVPGSGKIASWEIESEVWYKLAPDLSVGTYTRTTRNVYALSNRWVVYPSFGVKYSF